MQSWLAGFPLQAGEIGYWVTPEAGAQGPRQAPLFQPAAEIAPALSIDATELTGGGWPEPRCGSRDHRTSPRNTMAGEAILRPVARRS